MFNRARTLIPDRPVEEAVPESPRKAKQKSSTSIRAVIEEALPEASAEPELDWPVIQPSRRPTPEPAEPIESEPDQQVVAAQAKAGDYILPDPAVLLSEPSGPLGRVTEEEIKAQSDVLTRALLSFGIAGKVTEVRPGPVVTMYEFEPAPGTKVARIVNLADDLALALKAISLRIVAPIPGKSVVGIEVPNLYRETVSMKEVVTSESVFTRQIEAQPWPWGRTFSEPHDRRSENDAALAGSRCHRGREKRQSQYDAPEPAVFGSTR